MRHCCEFKADDVYFLKESALYNKSKLSVGYCPICGKPVAELMKVSFNGSVERIIKSGLKADRLVLENKDNILYSAKEINTIRTKSKPWSWRYGVNKSVKIKGVEHVKQYAYDFYGNKELIKTV